MKTIQVKPGKPSKFYINNKRINLNTAFGMYQKGAKFTVNGKKINLNKFGNRMTRPLPNDRERAELRVAQRRRARRSQRNGNLRTRQRMLIDQAWQQIGRPRRDLGERANVITRRQEALDRLRDFFGSDQFDRDFFGNDQFDELISLVRRRNTLMNELGRDPEGWRELSGIGTELYDMVNTLDERERNYILRAFEHEGPGLVRTMFDDGGEDDLILFDEAEPPPRGPQRRGFAPAATIWDAAP